MRFALLLVALATASCDLLGGPTISGITPTSGDGEEMGRPDPDDWHVEGTADAGTAVAPAYPNPTHSMSTVRVFLGSAQSVRIRLLDDRESEIRVIHDGRLEEPAYSFAIEAPEEAPGIFRVAIEGEGWRSHGDIRFEVQE